MPEQQHNIFLTKENLAFSMPLILVCTVYAYFKYIPLRIGGPLLLGIFMLYQIKAQFTKQRAKKGSNLDERAIADIVGDEMDVAAAQKTTAAATTRTKAKNKVQARLAQERKAANRQNGGGVPGQDDDDDDLLAFASSAANKKKNK